VLQFRRHGIDGVDGMSYPFSLSLSLFVSSSHLTIFHENHHDHVPLSFAFVKGSSFRSLL
jgi:hypothetical protein